MSHNQKDLDGGVVAGFAMMAVMMLCCVGVFLLFLLIPLVGWLPGVAIVAAGAVVMLVFHQRFMRHGHH